MEGGTEANAPLHLRGQSSKWRAQWILRIASSLWYLLGACSASPRGLSRLPDPSPVLFALLRDLERALPSHGQGLGGPVPSSGPALPRRPADALCPGPSQSVDRQLLWPDHCHELHLADLFKDGARSPTTMSQQSATAITAWDIRGTCPLPFCPAIPCRRPHPSHDTNRPFK
jgi:hypothetical protein